jgi:hypothetical protein
MGESNLFQYYFARHIFAFGKNVAGNGKVSAPAAQKPKGILVFFVENRIKHNIKVLSFSYSKKCEFALVKKTTF